MAAEMSVRHGKRVNYDRESGLLVTNSDDGKTVAIMPIVGSLAKRGDLCTYGMRDYEGMIHAMNQADGIVGMLQEMDTPGGSADGTPSFAKTIRDSQKPIGTFGDSQVASAGMWLASQSRFISANANNPTSFGSIGTLFINENWAKFIETNIGSIEIIRAPQSIDKARLNPFEEMPEETRNELIEELRDLTNDFITEVGSGRGLKVTKGKDGKRIIISPEDGEPENITTGRMYSADRALSLGLIDHIETFADAINRVAALAESTQKAKIGNSTKQSIQISSNMKILQWLGFSAQTEEKLSAEEKQSLASAEGKLNRLETENTLLKEQALQNTELIGELKTEIKQKDTQIQKLTAQLEDTPLEPTPETTQREDPSPDPHAENQKTIDNLPHNKALEGNPMFSGKNTEPKTFNFKNQ